VHTCSVDPCSVEPCLVDPCAVLDSCSAVRGHRPAAAAAAAAVAVVAVVADGDGRAGEDSYMAAAASSLVARPCHMEQN
jgi:hypothetical protein